MSSCLSNDARAHLAVLYMRRKHGKVENVRFKDGGMYDPSHTTIVECGHGVRVEQHHSGFNHPPRVKVLVEVGRKWGMPRRIDVSHEQGPWVLHAEAALLRAYTTSKMNYDRAMLAKDAAREAELKVAASVLPETC